MGTTIVGLAMNEPHFLFGIWLSFAIYHSADNENWSGNLHVATITNCPLINHLISRSFMMWSCSLFITSSPLWASIYIVCREKKLFFFFLHYIFFIGWYEQKEVKKNEKKKKEHILKIFRRKFRQTIFKRNWNDKISFSNFFFCFLFS